MNTELAAEIAIRAGLARNATELVQAVLVLEHFNWHDALEAIDRPGFVRSDLRAFAVTLAGAR